MDASRSAQGAGIPAWQAGLGTAGLAALASLTPSLYPRSGKQQAIVTGISVAAAFGVGAGVDAVADAVDSHSGLDALGARVAVAGTAGVGIAATTLLLRAHPGSAALGATRTGLAVVAGAALVSAGLLGERAAADRLAPNMPGGAATAHVALLGAATLGTAALMFGRVRPGAVSAEAQAAFLQTRTAGVPDVAHVEFDGARHAQVEALRAGMTTVSGVGDATLFPRAGLTPAGVRFTSEALPRQEIDRVMGLAAGTASDPVRVFGGYDRGADIAAQADRIFAESKRLGAFEKGTVVLAAPTGSGYLYPETFTSLENWLEGDVASVAMQWNDQPSMKSYDEVPAAQELFGAVIDRFAGHIATLPADARPKLVGYGESLGGDSLKDMFATTGTQGLADRGIDLLLTSGNDRDSLFRKAYVGVAGQRMSADGSVFDHSAPGEVAALPAAARAKVRAFLLSHHDDPLGKVSMSMLWSRPSWLRNQDEALGVPRKMHWFPGVTGVQGALDMLNGADLKTGNFGRTGHDYRADMAGEIAAVLGVPHTAEQAASVQASAVQAELARKFLPLPGEV